MNLSLRSLLGFIMLLPLLATAKDFSLERAEAIKILSQSVVNHEIETIKFRRIVMGRPGLNLYVVFLSDKGQPTDYFVTDGKCSSSKKHLVSKQKMVEGKVGVDSEREGVYGDFVMKKSGVDGTYGSSSPYVYCKTTAGIYKQWNGKYYISDAPLELAIEPVIVSKR